MSGNIRMRFPSDTFVKRQFTYLGEYAHQFYQLPGKYIKSETNEYPDITGSNKKADVVYSVEMDDKSIMYINLEDETTHVNEKTFEKINGYKNFIFYKNRDPVISAISTTLHLDNCLKEMWISQTELLKPIIKSLPSEGAWKKLYSLIDKCKKQEEFTAVEGLELINMPRCCEKNQALAVEMICEQLPNIKIPDSYIKNELIYSMQCMIHQYAKTDKDILRLEEMIGLQHAMKKRSPVLDNMERQGEIKGLEKGRKEGKEIGEKIGEEKGMKKGIKKGRKEGMKKGRKEGREEGNLQVLKALANNTDNRIIVEDLAKKFGYTIDQVLNSK